MHPTESTAQSLETLIINIKKKDLHVVTVSEAVDEKRITNRYVIGFLSSIDLGGMFVD